jgi:hypothetical protein
MQGANITPILFLIYFDSHSFSEILFFADNVTKPELN